MGVVLCLKELKANPSYKYFLLKRLSVTQRTKRVEGLHKHEFLIYNKQHPMYGVAAGSLFVMFLQVITEVTISTILTEK